MAISTAVARAAEHVGRGLKRGAPHGEAVAAMVRAHERLQRRARSLEL